MRHADWMERDERMDTADEMITHVAIRHEGEIFQLTKPYRHHDVIRLIIDKKKVTRVGGDSVQGFTTNTNRFVDREAACVIALRAHQVRVKHGAANELFSEDLW